MFGKGYRNLLHVVAVFTIFIYGLFSASGWLVNADEYVISGNGSGSDNQISVEVETDTVVEQNNEANITTEVSVEADTGSNESLNNIGDTSITTGDIESGLTIDTAANFSSVDLGCCEADTDVVIIDNGTDSTNSVLIDKDVDTSIKIAQSADIGTSVDGSLNTGRNEANGNVGDVVIDTGNIYATGGITNGPINVHDVNGGSGGGDLSIKISGNADGSENIITYNTFFSNDINVFNFADLFNQSWWDLNTGDNQANGNVGNVEIRTGDIIFDFFIKNGPINVGGIDWGCCDYGGPDDPGDPGDPGDPDDPGDPGQGGTGSSSDSGGEILASAASTEAGGPSVMGLSDTSSEAAQALFFWFGVGLLIFGVALVSKELLISPSTI